MGSLKRFTTLLDHVGEHMPKIDDVVDLPDLSLADARDLAFMVAGDDDREQTDSAP